jgi:hypothetical protein
MEETMLEDRVVKPLVTFDLREHDFRIFKEHFKDTFGDYLLAPYVKVNGVWVPETYNPQLGLVKVLPSTRFENYYGKKMGPLKFFRFGPEFQADTIHSLMFCVADNGDRSRALFEYTFSINTESQTPKIAFLQGLDHGKPTERIKGLYISRGDHHIPWSTSRTENIFYKIE